MKHITPPLLIILALLVGCTHEPPPFIENLPGGASVVAHRGGADLAPENTLAAIDLAVAPLIGAEIIEVDFHTTSDGEIVVIHDRTVDRVTGEGNGCETAQDTEEETFGSLRVHEMTLAEVQALDAGYCWEDPNAAADATDAELYPYRGAGVTIPTLRQVLESHADQRFVLEFKQGGMTEAVLDLVDELDAFERSCFLYFDPDETAEIAEAMPDNACIAMSSEGIRCWAAESIMPFGGGSCEDYDLAWFPHDNSGYDLKKQRLVDNMHASDTPIFFWTINEEALMDEVLALDVDGIITDRPDVLRDVLQLR